jgi:hypothetical protein
MRSFLTGCGRWVTSNEMDEEMIGWFPRNNRMSRGMEKTKTFLLILVLAITATMGAAQPAAALSDLAPSKADEGCTYMIPATVNVVDGQQNYKEVKPGDVLCLPAGERDNLKLINLHGEPGKQVIVRNSRGATTITGTNFLNGGISIYASSFLRLTGTGTGIQCGAMYSTEDQKCGIIITGIQKGIWISTEKDLETPHDLEIDHVWVSETSKDTKTRGIAIHPAPGQLISGLYIHHNFVARTLAEGIYMGTEPHGQPLEALGKIENLEVSYNRVEQTGYDGIKVKVAIKNVKVHHNVIHDTGLSNTPAHQGGIKIAMTDGQFYNNYVEGALEGIRSDRPLDGMTEARYFNNVVVNTSSVGIEAAEEGALIFNNTVVSCGDLGIVGDAKTAQVFDNIVAGCDGKAVKAKYADDGTLQKFNNLVGSLNTIGFVDPAQGDYHLLPHSKAIDAGQVGPNPLTYDYDGRLRPRGRGPDIGAFEYQAWINSGGLQ